MQVNVCAKRYKNGNKSVIIETQYANIDDKKIAGRKFCNLEPLFPEHMIFRGTRHASHFQYPELTTAYSNVFYECY